MWFTEIGGKYEELVPGIVDDLNNNKIKFADVPELKEALDQLNDMAQKGYFGDNYLSDEYTDLLMNLGSGEYAMALEKPGQISAIAEASDGKYTEDDFGMFVIPLMDNDVYPQHPCDRPDLYIPVPSIRKKQNSIWNTSHLLTVYST